MGKAIWGTINCKVVICVLGLLLSAAAPPWEAEYCTMLLQSCVHLFISFSLPFSPIHSLLWNACRHPIRRILKWKCHQQNRKALTCEAGPDDNTLIRLFLNIYDPQTFEMCSMAWKSLNCVVSLILYKIICISAFIVYLFFLSFFLWLRHLG